MTKWICEFIQSYAKKRYDIYITYTYSNHSLIKNI